MRVGTMFLGTVDSLGGESIQTKFFILGVPLFPISSHYVVAETVGGIKGFEIPLHGKSVGLGYLRMAAWIAALVAGVLYFIDKRQHGDLLVPTIVLTALAIGATFFLGRLSRYERLRRGLLKQIAGVGAPPDLLPADVRTSTADALRTAWERDHAGLPWDRAIENGSTDLLLFAVAEYHGRPDLARRALEGQGADPHGAGPYR